MSAPDPYEQGPYPPGPYPQAGYGPPGHPYAPAGYGPAAYGPAGDGRGGRVRYLPGAGTVVALIGLVGAALSLFALSWVDGSKGSFTDFSSAARTAGSDHLNLALYVYLAWAGYVLFGLAVVLALLALLPLPPSAAGNTYARVALAVSAGLATVLHIWTMHKLSGGDTVLHVGAWLGVLGYLAVLASTIVGARRVPA